MFQKAKWIWVENRSLPDSYGEFYDEFVWNGEKTVCKLSCDGDYTLFINGRYVCSNQYGDFEWYKSCDSIDVTSYLQSGKNTIAVLVWHFGADSQRYINARAGLIFEVLEKESVLVFSDENTRARYSKAYHNGRQKKVTRQLGFSFAYDSTKEDAWQTTGKGMNAAVCVEKNCTFVPRPIEKLLLGERIAGKVIVAENNRYLIDLGKETVGLPIVDLISSETQTICIAWGEDLQDGHVRRLIGERDFSFDYVAKQGKNQYFNGMLRLGCRYLEVFTEKPIQINYVSLIPQYYKTQPVKFALKDHLEQKIYDICTRTLQLSMMEHYVDTPWREQCLYVFDSRNQMLCGYYAFEDKNAAYARSNLKLISEDRRNDGLLAICYPCGMDLTIPSFSLYYFIAVREYFEYTGDLSLVEEVYPKLRSVLDVFIHNRKDGLIYRFEGDNHWNFYDWSLYLEGHSEAEKALVPDLIVNTLFLLALDSLRTLDNALGKPFAYDSLYKEGMRRTKETFYCKEKEVFSITPSGNEYTTLGNALAILAGLTSSTEAETICEKLVDGTLNDSSLSMKCFKYDALLSVNQEKWSGWILEEIRKDYGKMIEAGSTTVWETIDGASAFGNAGSLCHGWSAIPVYYYHKLRRL